MTTTALHHCAGTTKKGTPCRVLIKPSRVFCDWHAPAALDESGLREVMRAVGDLGVLKAGERQSVVHARANCPVFTDRTAACTCGTAVRIEWADWDEVRPGCKTTPTSAE